MRAVLFDVDGVLIHGYHAKPEKQLRWDERLLADLGVDPERFRHEFIYDIFVKQVLIGRMPLIEALDRVLPSLGYHGSAMVFAEYWLSHDSVVNQPLLDAIGRLRETSELKLYIATNQDHMRAQWLWMGLRFSALFDDMFYSARVGATKPSTTYFNWVGGRIGKQEEPPLLFDDREDIVAGAREHGWEAVQFDELEDFTAHPWVAPRLAATTGSIVTSR